jgi:hypothetical protein
MSDKKIGRWFVLDEEGGVSTGFSNHAYAEAKSHEWDAPGRSHRVIYMEETDPPKEEEECPELECGDYAISGDGTYYILDVQEKGAPLKYFTLKNGDCFVWSDVRADKIYRHGKKIWWKGKTRD